jgi:hypothetical protein
MNIMMVLVLSEKYANCLDCGNEYIGNGEGSLIVTNDSFKRSCKCGWSVEIKEGE